jgi:adenosylmethionine-8-amino-7-oxononanoate aminotransferase
MHQLAFGAPTMATTTRALELVERLRAIVPSEYTTMKFLSGGSEAIESALKLARQYHKQTGHPGKYKVLSHYCSYHGATGYALAATGWPQFKDAYEPFAPGFIHVQPPDPDAAAFPATSPDEAGLIYARLVEQTVAREGPETVAAILSEPILFSAGVVVPPDSYLRALRAICDRYNILLVYDEIITGFGRTGRWFGAEHSGVWPHLLCCAKGITGGYSPLSALFMTDRVAAAFWGEPADLVQFHAGHTYGGNPVACAAALAALDYIERHALIDHAAEVGSYLSVQLGDLAARHSLIRGVRGRGLLQALVLGTDTAAAGSGLPPAETDGRAIGREARRLGLLLRVAPWFVAVAPPLITTAADVDRIVAILEAAIVTTEGAGLVPQARESVEVAT